MSRVRCAPCTLTLVDSRVRHCKTPAASHVVATSSRSSYNVAAPGSVLQDARLQRRSRACCRHARAACTTVARAHGGAAASARCAALRLRPRCHLPRAPRPPSGACPSAGGLDAAARRSRAFRCAVCSPLCGVAAPPLTRPAQLQRKHREEKLLSNRDALDALRLLGVERIECLRVYGQARLRPAGGWGADPVHALTRTRLLRRRASTCTTKPTSGTPAPRPPRPLPPPRRLLPSPRRKSPTALATTAAAPTRRRTSRTSQSSRWRASTR